MGRIRTIKPEFPQSESMGRVSRDSRLFFILLWGVCDDSGRTRGASRLLASLLYPYDKDAPKLIDQWIHQLEREKCLRRYVVEGDTYIEVCNWLKHQKIDKPSKPMFPPPRTLGEDSRGLGEGSALDQGSGIRDQGMDQGGEGTSAADAAESEPEGFRRFWDAYPPGPRKVNRRGCLKTWTARSLEAHTEAIVAGLERWKTSRQWRENGGQFVPQPATWLNQDRWETDPNEGNGNGPNNGRLGSHGGTAVEKASARNQARRAHEFDDGEIPLPIGPTRSVAQRMRTPPDALLGGS